MIIRRIFFSIMALVVFISQAQNLTTEIYNKEPFFDDFDSDVVNKQNWRIATWAEHGGKTSTERCYVEDGFLKLIFINDAKNGFLSSAIETKDKFLFGKWEAKLKPSNVPGILNSFYTIDWDNTSTSAASDGTKQEIDIEFLTYTFKKNYGEVHFAVHEDGSKSFNTNPDTKLNFNPSDDFHVWGFEITPEYIKWFVDDIALKRYVYKENAFPITNPYNLKLNVWSAEKWINGPPEKDVTCTYLIDWIKFTPHKQNNVAPQIQKTGMYIKQPRDLSDQNFNLRGQIVNPESKLGAPSLLVEKTSGYSQNIKNNKYDPKVSGFKLGK